jgi:Phytanoyl-CoA dioxygenase (PhyH).
MYLNQEEIEKFEQDGFLVLKDFVSQDACESLSNQATEIVKAFDPAESVSIFTTNKTNQTFRPLFSGIRR